jgi:hypothetical protein
MCLRLEVQVMLRAVSRALLRLGSSRLARIAMMAITTRSSISVKIFMALKLYNVDAVIDNF